MCGLKCIVYSASLDASNPCLDVNVDLWVALADADLCARFDQGGHHKLIVAEKVCGFNSYANFNQTITTW
jgi:hypothetical protein